MRQIPSFAAVLALLWAPYSHAEVPVKPSSLDQRVESLEQELREFTQSYHDGPGRVRAFLNDSILLGGFFESAILGIAGPDMDEQLSVTSNILGINLVAEFNDDLRFNTQILTGLAIPLENPDNDPRAQSLGLTDRRRFGSFLFGIVPAQGYVEYTATQGAKIQAGLGYVPFGIAFQQRELVLFRRRGGPQMLSTTGRSGVVIASPLWSGIHILGSFPVPSGRWGYDAYTLTPVSNTRSVGGGARLWWAMFDALTLGASTQVAKRDAETYEAMGVDAKLNLGPFGIDTEYSLNLSDGDDPWSFYVEPYVKVMDDELLLYLVIDYIDNPLGQVAGPLGTLAGPFKKWLYGAGVNWIPFANTRLRLGFLRHDYVGDTETINGQRRDYYALDLSAGVAF